MLSVDPKFAVAITSPPSDTNNLSNSFVAYGISDRAYSMSGQMINGQGTYAGTVLQGPPASQTWYIQFTGVPAGTGYTLTAWDTEGFADHSTNLTVLAPAFC
jgi:hypothetical protein